MSSLRKKGTDEGITSDILKACFCVIGEELTRLINDSLNKGTCPEGWRTSTIIPIPKIEKPKKASEYRPINILPMYKKVLELVVKEQFEKYFYKIIILLQNTNRVLKRITRARQRYKLFLMIGKCQLGRRMKEILWE